MKRIVAIFLTLLYTVSTIGVMGSSFYCHGKLQGTNITLVAEAKDCCKEEKEMACKPKNDDGCCNTKTFFVKVADQHSPSIRISIAADEVVKFFPVLHLSIPSIENSVAYAPSFLLRNFPPPLAHKQPVYLDLCNFRI